MKRSGKHKTLRSLAWLMIACLTMTTIAPGLTAFAAEKYGNTDFSTHEKNSKKDKKQAHGKRSGRSSSSDWEVIVEATKDEEEEYEPDAFDGLIDLVPASPSNTEKGVCEYNGKYYETIEEAVKALGSGKGTITLIDDVEFEDVIEIKEGQITFDLGGYTLKGVIYITKGSEVTVKNGTIDSGEKYWKIYASGSDDHPTRFTLAKDADIKAVDYGLLLCGVTGSSDTNGTGFVVTIDGNIKVTDPKGSGIWFQGKMQTTTAKVCDLTVNGTVESGIEDGPGIAINGWGNVTVNEGARVVGATGIEIRSGSLTVNGGSIMGATEEFSYEPNGKGSTSIGAGITINEHETDKPIRVNIKDGDISGYYALTQINTQNKMNKITMSVTGGNFTGYDRDCAVLLEEYEDNKDKFSITGGTFTDNYGAKSDISAYLSAEYAQDDEGGIMPADSIIKFGDEYYSSIEDAISAIQHESNPTLTIVADVDDLTPIEIKADQKLNMNLSGHTMQIIGEETAFSNKGELTISGGGTIISENLAVSNEGSTLTVASDAAIISQKSVAVANMSGDLNISGTVTSESTSAIVTEGGRVNVTGGAVTGSKAMEVNGGEVNIIGGTLTGTDGYSLYVTSGRIRDGISVTIEGGEFVTTGEDCVYYESFGVPESVDISEPAGPIAIYCGRFSNERGLEKFYATDKTDGARNDRYFDVFTYERADIIEQSCTQDGSTTYVCSYCGREYIEDIKAAPGHDWGRWEIVNEATLDKDGEIKRECARCHEVEKAVVNRTGFKLNVNILDNDGHAAEDVRFEIYDNTGNKAGDTFTQKAEIYLLPGNYTIVITESNGYNFNFTSLEFTLDKDYPVTIIGTYIGINGDEDEETPAETPDEEEKPGIDETPDHSAAVTPDDGVVDTPDNSDTAHGSGSSGHHSSSGSSGGSGSNVVRPAEVSTIYIGSNGMTAEWSLSGLRFTKTDGTYPSNEYLIIDGVIYAFYTNGYAVSLDNGAYYSADAIPALEDIPVAEGTWELCGWWLKYSDGSYPRNDWAMLSHDGRTDRYYFDADGWMVTGWKQINGFWYYFGADGALLTDTTTPDGHRVDANGRLAI